MNKPRPREIYREEINGYRLTVFSAGYKCRGYGRTRRYERVLPTAHVTFGRNFGDSVRAFNDKDAITEGKRLLARYLEA